MKKTVEIYINNTEAKAAEAIRVADDFINELGLEGKKAIHLRLLAEETVGMVRAMTGDFQARFSMENEDGENRIKLLVETTMDRDKKSELLSVSTKGKNVAARGFMGKIREIIENSLLDYDEAMKMQQEYGGGMPDYAYMGMGFPMTNPIALPAQEGPITWSLSNYRDALEEAPDSEESVQEAWDELEKSIVANIAKEVTVGVRKDRVDLTITA